MYNQIDSNKRKTWLLMTVFFVVIVMLGWIFGEAYDFGYGGLILAALLAVIINLVSFFNGDKVALAVAGAKKIDKADNPELYRLVENLCLTAGLPLPKIYLIEEMALNAFATGRNPEHAVVAVTRGLLERLERQELEGVLAHELSHIGNRDMLLSTVVV